MIQNKWLSYTIHRVILTCLGGPFFPKTVNKWNEGCFQTHCWYQL